MNYKKNPVFNPWNTKKIWSEVLKLELQVLFHIVMAKFPIPEIFCPSLQYAYNKMNV